MLPSHPIRPPRAHCGQPSENGYILLGVMILLAIFMIGMTFAAPKIAYDIQRDREIETMHRGKQYVRAVQLYYKKFQAYPPNMEALVKTQEIRFLRKRYIDPLTGKDDWKTIAYCQNKAPIAMGFFGQPLGPTSGCGTLAGTGPGGVNGANGLQSGSIFGDQSGNGTGGNPAGSGLNSPSGSIFSNSGTTGTPGTPASGIGSSDGSTGAPGISSTGAPGATAPTTDANGNPTSADNGQTLGGGGIIGVSPPAEKASILVYKKKKKYNEWEFTYGPQMDTQNVMGGNTGTIGAPVGGPGTGTGTGTGLTPGGGSGGGIVSPPPSPSPSPTPPPQQ